MAAAFATYRSGEGKSYSIGGWRQQVYSLHDSGDFISTHCCLTQAEQLYLPRRISPLKSAGSCPRGKLVHDFETVLLYDFSNLSDISLIK